MSKTRIIRNVLIGIAAVTACLAIVVAVTINTSWFRNFLRGEIGKLALQDAGAHVQIGSISTHWTRFVFDLNNVVVDGNQNPSPNQPPLLQATRLEIGLRFWPLLHKHVELSTLILDKPVIHLRIDAQGRSNMPVSPHPSKSGSGTDTIFNLKIADCAINSGQIFYNDAEVPLNARLHDLNLKTTYSLLASEYKGSLSYDQGVLVARQLGAINNAMQVQFSATRSGLSLSPLVLTSGASRLTLNATVTNYQVPNIDGKYDATLATGELANILRSPSLPTGTVTSRGTLAYQAGQDRPFIAALNVQGRMHSDRLTFQRGQTDLPANNVSADYSLQDGTLRVPNLVADTLGGKARANFEMQHVDAQHASSRLEASLQGVSLTTSSNEFSSGNARKVPFVGTTDLQLTAAWAGAIQDAVAHARLTITSHGGPASAQSIPVNGLVTVDYNGPRSTISFGQSYLRTSNTHLSIAGTLSSQKGGHSTLTLLATTNDLNETAEVADMVQSAMQPAGTPSRIPQLGGSASLTVRATGTAKNPQLVGRLTAANLSVAGSHWQALALNIKGNSSSIEIENGAVTTGGKAQLLFSGAAGLHNWKLGEDSQIQLHASVTNMQLATVQAIGELHYPLTGTVSANISVTGTKSAPNGKATLVVSDASAWNEPVKNLAVDAEFRGGAIQSTVNLEIPAGKLSLKANYVLSTQQYDLNLAGNGLALAKIPALQSRARIEGVANIQASGTGTLHDPQLEMKLSVPQLQAEGQTISNTMAQINVANQHAVVALQSTVAKGSVEARGDIALTGDRYTTATVDIRALPIAAIAADFLSSQASKIGGQTEINLSVKGPLKSPSQMQAQLQIPTLTLTYGTAQIGLARPLLANYAGGTLTVAPSQIKGPGTNLTFGGTVPIKSAAAYSLVADGSVDLGAIQQFDPNVKAAGQVDIHIHSGGQLSKPTMQGELQVKNGEFTTESLPLGVDNLNAQINLSGNRADIANFSGTVGGGTVSARGFATIGHGSTFNLALNADSVRLRYPEGLRSVLTTQLNFRGDTNSSFLTGRVQVDGLEFTQQFDLASFAGAFSETSVGGPPSPFEKSVKLNVAVNSLQQINLASNKLSIGGSANLDVVGTMAQPVVLGRIGLTSGEIFFLGKRFEIQSGTIEFANPVRTEPVVRMFVNTRIEQYNITLNLSGPVDRLRTNYTSDPALPPADIIHLLAFGNTTEEASAQPSQGAAMGAESVLAQGVGSKVAGSLENLTGISQVTIDPLATGSSGQPGQQIAIQERVTGSLLFTFSTNVTTTQGQTVELQYDLNRRVSVTVLRDQNGGYGLDLRWHKVF
ncbi:MAG: translocation/assembly module TamB domain-containing protein [Candidatus Acidiferrales bacterium]